MQIHHNQLFMLRMVLAKYYKFDIDINQLFVVFKEAYDSINRKELFKIMKEFGIPQKLVIKNIISLKT